MTRTAGCRAAILLYHRVADDIRDPFELCVRPDVFSRQMEHLQQRYRVMTLADVCAGLRSNVLPDRAVAITFDDGYLDNLVTASPRLLSSGVPATFFLTTCGLDTPCEYWWDTLANAEDVTTAEARDFHLRTVRAPWHQRARLLAERAERWPPSKGGPRPMTSSEALDLASRPGHDVGSHTVNHLSLPDQDADVARAELQNSRAALQSLLNRTITALAYPFGAVDSGVRSTANDAGFTCGVTVRAALALESDDMLLLPRFTAPATVEGLSRLLSDAFESPG
jgi:peptidoglycan/xylan/chitin deacetylase (PgdA/CDA1 family)